MRRLSWTVLIGFGLVEMMVMKRTMMRNALGSVYLVEALVARVKVLHRLLTLWLVVY